MTEQIMASPLPGEMEGNEPPVSPDAPDQIPFPDIEEDVEDDHS